MGGWGENIDMDASYSFFSFFHVDFVLLGFTKRVFNEIVLMVKSLKEYYTISPSLRFFPQDFSLQGLNETYFYDHLKEDIMK